MGMCEQELLVYKLKELFCKKSCNDCCDICLVDCCKDKDCKDKKSCDYCDCCVNPMEYLLKQFEYGDTIYLLTDEPYFYDGWTFIGVNNDILTITPYIGSGYVEKISVCKIESIGLPPEGQDIEDIELLDNKCKSDKGYCGCCEAPIRKQLESYKGLYVSIYTNNYWYDGYVYAVSDGIVILEYYGYYIAISTCKIVSVGLEQFMPDAGAGTDESGKNNPKLANIRTNPLQEKNKKK